MTRPAATTHESSTRPPVMELWGVRTGVRFGGACHAPNPPSVATLTPTPPPHAFTCQPVQA